MHTDIIEASIFRAYDIRGLVGHQIHPQLAYLLARALSTLACREGLSRFCVGYDGRHSSAALARAMHKGFQESGIQVIDTGLITTPQLYFATVHCDTHCGVMITGSHNPPQYNGFKMVVSGRTLALEEISTVYDIIQTRDFVEGKASITAVDIDTPYIAELKRLHPAGHAQRIVIDAGNGVTAQIAPALFSQLGHQVIPLYCDLDGNFPNHHPDPGNPENLVDLQRAVCEHKADMGFAFDGDGDRLGIVTDTGDIVFPDKAMMLFAEDMLSRHQGAEVIVDVKSSPLLVQHIEHNGGKATIWNTGHSLIKRKMKETGALLAGEMSGHIFFGEHWYGFDDALLAGARLATILDNRNQSASEAFAAYPSWVSTPEINLITTDNDKFIFVERLKHQVDFGDCIKNDLDGIRVEYPDRWGLVRCSNTTPALVLRFEAVDQHSLSSIVHIFKCGLDAVAPTLDTSPLLSYIS